MNKHIKFHKANGPAFAVGEQWHNGYNHNYVTIKSVRNWGPNKWDYDVTYTWTNANGEECEHTKDAWNFQVRYMHKSDNVIKSSQYRNKIAMV